MIKENSKKEEQITLENKEEVLDVFEEKYNKEIAPIFKILKPDDIDFADFENQTKEELFSDVKKLQISRGEYVSKPEDSIVEAKNLLINRIKSALEDYNNEKNKKKIDSDFIKKCKLVLLVENDDTDIKLKKSLEYNSNHPKIEDVSVSSLQNYLSKKYDDKLSESEMEVLMNTKYKNSLINMKYHDFWLSCSNEVPEVLLLEMVKIKNSETSIIGQVLDKSKDKKYSIKLLTELIKSNKYDYLKHLDRFESYDIETLFDAPIYDDPYRLAGAAEYIENSNLSLPQKNELYLYIFKKAISLEANNNNFKNFFYLKNINEFLSKTETHDLFIKYISNNLLSYYNPSDTLHQNITIPNEVLIKAAEDAAKRAITTDNIDIEIIRTLLRYLPPEFFKSPEIISLLENTIMESFSGNKDINKAVQLLSNFKNQLPREFIESPKVIDAAKNYISQNAESIDFNTIFFFKEELGIQDEFFHLNEIEIKLKKALVNNFTSETISPQAAYSFLKNFRYSDDIFKTEEIKKIIENKILESVKSLNYNNIEMILRNFNVSSEFLNSPELEEAVVNTMSNNLGANNYKSIISLIEILHFSDKIFINEKLIEVFDSLIIDRNIEELKRFVKNFKFLKEGYSSYDSNTSVVLEKILKHSSVKDLDIEKISVLKNTNESFLVRENREGMDKEILEIVNKFENNYGSKGKDLVVLAVSVYGTENKERFIKEMEKIEKVLNKYDHDSIPDGAKVSMGIEYEVTKSIASAYSENNILDYKKSIETISESANIGRGNDGVHEIATKPNYNPYMLMAEVRLLQEGGFLDLNFEHYKKAPRGYHLSLVGDSGLHVDKEMYFLNNIMTMSQLTGIVAGKEIQYSKDIFSKSFDKLDNYEQEGVRCEIKGMATDSVEQFEKAIITAHNAGIAIQMYNKDQNNEVESKKEKLISLEWIKLKEEIEGLIDEHNQFFIDSEFKSGYSIDKDGKFIDTHIHIDTQRNSDLLGEVAVNSENFKNKIQLNKDHLYSQQRAEFVNTLIGINNIFLKNQIAGQNTTVNASNMLNTMKAENYGPILEGKPQESIFENGGKIRDGYYCVQGASEEMITHKSQIILNRFNRNMEKLLNMKEEKVLVEVEKTL